MGNAKSGGIMGRTKNSSNDHVCGFVWTYFVAMKEDLSVYSQQCT